MFGNLKCKFNTYKNNKVKTFSICIFYNFNVALKLILIKQV